jgi:hypothetical protein
MQACAYVRYVCNVCNICLCLHTHTYSRMVLVSREYLLCDLFFHVGLRKSAQTGRQTDRQTPAIWNTFRESSSRVTSVIYYYPALVLHID